MTLSRSYGHCFHSILDTTLPIPVLAKEAHKTYITAPAKDVVAPLLGGLFPTSRVNHLLALASWRWARHRWFYMTLTGLCGPTFTSSSEEMKAVFEDVLCPLFKCPPAYGEETKTSLWGYCNYKKARFFSHACTRTRQGVWSPEIWSKVGSESSGFIAQENMGNGVELNRAGLVATQLGTGPL